MVFPTSLVLLTCIGCPSTSSQPTQPLPHIPQPETAPVLNLPTLQQAYTEAANLATPDASSAVEWSARSREANPATLLKRGSQGAMVARLQARLARLGYPITKIDGKFGPQTQAVVMQFQNANGLVVDGVVDASSWAKLNDKITRSGQVPSLQSLQPQVVQPVQTLQPVKAGLPSPVTVSPVSQPIVANNPSDSWFSQKTGWIVVLVILQGVGWLVILQGVDKELVLLTGRSLFPGKTRQWLFSAKP